MIISETLNVEITKKGQIRYYKSVGYNIKIGDTIKIDISSLSKESHMIIEAKCDICGTIKKVTYRYYLKRIETHNIFCCSCNCSKIKTQKTKLEKYGDKNYTNRNKFKTTCLKKYGVTTTLLCNDTKDKIKKTNLERYGIDHFNKNINVKNKHKQTDLERYGTDSSNQNEEIKIKKKKSFLIKYGFDNPMKNENIKNKVKETCIKKYGVEYPSQNIEIQNKQVKTNFKKGTYQNIIYQGTYELDFLTKFYDKFKIERAKSIKYNFQNKIKIYYPDFYLPEYNLIIEIKNLWLLKRDFLIIEEKRKSVLNNGYNYLMIVNKNYTEFVNFFNLQK